MTTPLFRIGHIYAIRQRRKVYITWYLGAENGKYYFRGVFYEKLFAFSKHQLDKICYLGSYSTEIHI